MDTPTLLKEEVNKTLDSLHDFAKWKLIVVSALAASAIRLPGSDNQSEQNWLLGIVPLACAYVDLNSYQYLLRILLIAKVLRESQNNDPLLRKYENDCESVRQHGYFAMGMFAQRGSSLIISLILPGFACAQLILGNAESWKVGAFVTLWIVGIACVVICDMIFKSHQASVSKKAS